MVELWKNPSSIFTILLNSDIDDIKKYLAPFIVHNIYENISSINHNNEVQLIYIISLLYSMCLPKTVQNIICISFRNE